MFCFPDRFAKFILITPAPPETAHLVPGDCWEWVGSILKGSPEKHGHGRGYGRVKYEGRARYSHRVIWTLMSGRDPGELVLDHLCRRRACCNPLHLELTTTSINTLRGEAVLFKIAEHYTDRREQLKRIAGGDDFDGCSD